MKSILPLLALCAALPAFSADIDAPVLATRRAVPLTWCSLGTSITWYNNHVSSAFTKGYQTRVMEQIKFNGFVNKGVNAGCVSSAIGAVAPAGFYTIEHGINDWGNRVKPGTLADYENDTGTGTFAGGYRKVVDKIRALNPEAKIILCTPRKGYGFGTYLPATCDAQQPNGYFLKDYADIVRAIAEKEGFVVADFFSTCGEQDELAGLSIDKALHPNDPGYQKMANELVKAILKVFPDAKEVVTAFTDDGRPKTVDFTEFLSSTPQVVLQGVDIAKVTVESASMGGAWIPGSPYASVIRHLRRDAEKKTTTFQVQVRPPDNCTRCVAVELAQEDSDVTARVLWARYSFDWPVDADFTRKGYSGEAPIAAAQTELGYGVGQLAFGLNKPDHPSATAPAPEIEEEPEDTPSLQAGELAFEVDLATRPKIVMKDVDLATVEPEAATMAGAWIPGSPYKCSVHFVERNAAAKTLTCQFQILPPDACTRGICVEFRQHGKDVSAKILWARYIFNGPKPGVDFSKPGYSGEAPIAVGAAANGYGIPSVAFRKAQ